MQQVRAFSQNIPLILMHPPFRGKLVSEVTRLTSALEVMSDDLVDRMGDYLDPPRP
jgi:hypothetical protein